MLLFPLEIQLIMEPITAAPAGSSSDRYAPTSPTEDTNTGFDVGTLDVDVGKMYTQCPI